MKSAGANQTTVGRSHQRHAKNYLLKPAFQWKYAAAIIVGVFFVALIVSLQAYGILYEQARARTLFQSTTTSWDITLALVLAALVLATIPAVALSLWSIIITHRICGPMHVLERHFTQLAEGRFPQRRPLRPKDEFKEFHEAFWRAVDALKARKRSDLAALRQILDVVNSNVDADDQSRKRALEAIKARSEAMCTETERLLGVQPEVATPTPPAQRNARTGAEKAYAQTPG